MPIGFWAISRRDIEELIDFRFQERYSKPPQHSSGYYHLVNHIARDLPAVLDELKEGFIEKEIVSERSQGKLPAEGKIY